MRDASAQCGVQSRRWTTHQLAGDGGNVLDNGQTRAPLVVLGQVVNRRQQRLRKVLQANDGVDLVQARDDIEAHLGVLGKGRGAGGEVRGKKKKNT